MRTVNVGLKHIADYRSLLSRELTEEIDALQSHADVVPQKSDREGFRLTETEALWEARPKIGDAVGGIPLQLEDGFAGFLVDTVDACAERRPEILADTPAARGMRLRGKEHVRRDSLTPRLLCDYLKLMNELRGGSSTSGGVG